MRRVRHRRVAIKRRLSLIFRGKVGLGVGVGMINEADEPIPFAAMAFDSQQLFGIDEIAVGRSARETSRITLVEFVLGVAAGNQFNDLIGLDASGKRDATALGGVFRFGMLENSFPEFARHGKLAQFHVGQMV